MPWWLRWPLGLALALSVVLVPSLYYRAVYAHAKRFREVTPGRFYRSGQLTAQGLREVIERHQIKTVINLQNEAPDPLMRETYFGKPVIRESTLCQQLGVRYLLLEPDLLPPKHDEQERPRVIDEYLQVLDDPTAYPILLHCKAGLHRTGLLVAIYRMECEGWTVGEAIRELRANGFAHEDSTSANEYIAQYLQSYQTGIRRNPSNMSLKCARQGKDNRLWIRQPAEPAPSLEARP